MPAVQRPIQLFDLCTGHTDSSPSANNYQGEESETWLGEWMEQRKNRDEIVLATKFTTYYPGQQREVTVRSNYQGNHAKSLRVSLEASLKKLKTDYIDLVCSSQFRIAACALTHTPALCTLVGLHYVHS